MREILESLRPVIEPVFRFRAIAAEWLVVPCSVLMAWLMVIGVVWIFSRYRAERISYVTCWVIAGPVLIPLWILKPGNLVRVLTWICFRSRAQAEPVVSDNPSERPMSYGSMELDPVRRITL